MPPQLSDKELEERLASAGKSLLQPPSSVDELLPLLDQIEELLSKVEQSPAQSMQTVLSPIMKALVLEELLKHSDDDVKVGVASCISEITRITAPDAPYDDEKMKDVFQLIVSSFEDLSEISSRSYGKRAAILDIVAKVRSCVIMLDLECDQMIIEMFQHFLKAIRDYHPEPIFASMETTMTLVLEESEDISADLLNPILSTLKKNEVVTLGMNVLPIAKKLAERVIESSADKLRPYLPQVVKSLDSSVDDYGEVVASLCRDNIVKIGNSNKSISKDPQELATVEVTGDGEILLVTPVSISVKSAVKESGEKTDSQEQDPTMIGSTKSVVSNGVNETTCTEETVADANSSKEADSDHNQVDAKLGSKTESDDGGAQNSEKLEANDEIPSEDVPISATEAEPATDAEPATEAKPAPEPEPAPETEPAPEPEPAPEAEPALEAEPAPEAEPATEAELAPDAEPVEAADSLDKVKEDAKNQLSPSHSPENEAVVVSSPVHSISLSDESRSKKDSPAKGKENLVNEGKASVDISSKKASAGKSLSKSRKKKRGGKKLSGKKTMKDKELTGEGPSKNKGSTSDSEARSPDEAQKLGDANNKTEDLSSVTKGDGKKNANNKTEDLSSMTKGAGKKNGRVKLTSGKDASKSSAKEVPAEDKVASPRSPLKSSKDEDTEVETPRTVSKRKRTPGTEKTSGNIAYGKELVGSKVRVWWPKDKMFYEGVVESFDSVKKRHKVLYNDGDEEILNLGREKWELVKDDMVSDGDDDAEHSSDDTLSEINDCKLEISECRLQKYSIDSVVKKQKKKKGNTDSEASKSKRQKVDSTPKSKLKDTPTKSGGKSKDQVKTESDAKDSKSKPSKKAADEAIKVKSQGKVSGGKTKDESGKASGGKTKDESGKSSSGKTKEESAKTPSHPKQGSQKTVKSKGKTPQSGGKALSDGGGAKMAKTSSSKAKETDGKKEKLADLVKSSVPAKGKSVDSSKSRESEAKSGKKRKR
ncbi:sister chromatid cohesion protein PDS5 homolog A [Striga asiatica]|uniref:Sister chromatid cohesion protein PDS5 homolog A n=1 Tax=Striga asiatica TaxID=4170 RepID=A0A5A7R4T0_STRAF|nr:sister chromatid cohesion protein PDS5 homolog A [Striga asiatica]